MGVSTSWFGSIALSPPLTDELRAVVIALGEQDEEVADQPVGRLGWIPTDDGSALVWDRGEKFNGGSQWLQYLLTGPLTDHAGSGTVFGFRAPEAWLYETERIDVAGRDVRASNYEIPYVGDLLADDVEDDDFADCVFHLEESMGQDSEEATACLQAFFSNVALSELGEFRSFFDGLLAVIGNPPELTAVYHAAKEAAPDGSPRVDPSAKKKRWWQRD